MHSGIRVKVPQEAPSGDGESGLTEPARRGSLSKVARLMIEMLMRFVEARDRHTRTLFGQRLAYSEARMVLLRMVIMEWTLDRGLSLKSATRRLDYLASSSTIRAEARLMVELGVLHAERPEGGRVTCLYPTQRLIDWYNDQANNAMWDFLNPKGVLMRAISLFVHDKTKSQ